MPDRCPHGHLTSQSCTACGGATMLERAAKGRARAMFFGDPSGGAKGSEAALVSAVNYWQARAFAAETANTVPMFVEVDGRVIRECTR